jgi:hypothetical protein
MLVPKREDLPSPRIWPKSERPNTSSLFAEMSAQSSYRHIRPHTPFINPKTYQSKGEYASVIPAGTKSKCIPNLSAIFLISINVCLDILASSFGPCFHPGRIDAPRSFIAISDRRAFVMWRNQIFHESDPFLLLDRINCSESFVMHRLGTHPIPLLEIMDETGGRIEYRDCFWTTILPQKCLNVDIAKHLITKKASDQIVAPDKFLNAYFFFIDRVA